LGFYETGIYSLAISYTTIFFAVSSFGVRPYQISDVLHRHCDGTYIATRVISSGIALILFCLSLFFARFPPYTLICCFILLFFKFIESFTDVAYGILQKLNRYNKIAISDILRGIIPVVFFVLALVFKGLIWGLLAMAVSAALVLILFTIPSFINHKDFSRTVNLRESIIILASSIPIMLLYFVYPFFNFITRYTINFFFGEEKLGYYTSITVFIIIISYFLNSVLAVIAPWFSTLYIEEKYVSIRKNIFFLVLMILSGAFVLCCFCYFLGKNAISLVFGEKILPYYYLLIPTIIVSSIMAIVSVFNSVFLAIQKRKSALAANFSGVLVCSLLVYPMVKYFGMAASLYTLMISMGVQLIILFFMFENIIRKAKNQ
jgi:O-antigen/teichoic acid export membrane protein